MKKYTLSKESSLINPEYDILNEQKLSLKTFFFQILQPMVLIGEIFFIVCLMIRYYVILLFFSIKKKKNGNGL